MWLDYILVLISFARLFIRVNELNLNLVSTTTLIIVTHLLNHSYIDNWSEIRLSIKSFASFVRLWSFKIFLSLTITPYLKISVLFVRTDFSIAYFNCIKVKNCFI